jgi:hypothetical protein
MKMAKLNGAGSDRLTVSLGPGQRKILEDIAKLNDTTLAHVVRYALSHFIKENRDKQIPLRFPKAGESAES